ncbi:MAG: hypothetical protein PVS3B2_09820 [Candidatus Dormibacteraceae bacterium]
MVAEQHGGVGPVARETERAHAEGTVVDEVAEDDGSPFLCWVGLERLEEALKVAMHVAGDKDRQIVRSHSSMLIGPGIGALGVE